MNLREPRRKASRTGFSSDAEPQHLGAWWKLAEAVQAHRITWLLCSKVTDTSFCRASYWFCNLLRRLCWKTFLEGFCFSHAPDPSNLLHKFLSTLDLNLRLAVIQKSWQVDALKENQGLLNQRRHSSEVHQDRFTSESLEKHVNEQKMAQVGCKSTCSLFPADTNNLPHALSGTCINYDCAMQALPS